MCMIETGVFASKSQTGGYAGINPSDGEPGDIAGIPWVRYDARMRAPRTVLLSVKECLHLQSLQTELFLCNGGYGGK